MEYRNLNSYVLEPAVGLALVKVTLLRQLIFTFALPQDWGRTDYGQFKNDQRFKTRTIGALVETK